jgi:hypothetical protein
MRIITRSHKFAVPVQVRQFGVAQDAERQGGRGGEGEKRLRG